MKTDPEFHRCEACGFAETNLDCLYYNAEVGWLCRNCEPDPNRCDYCHRAIPNNSGSMGNGEHICGHCWLDQMTGSVANPGPRRHPRGGNQ